MVMCMVVLVVFSALAVSLAAMADANVQVANNQRQVSKAFTNAESGLNVMGYWLARVEMSSSTPPADYVKTIIDLVQSDLQANGITNVVVNNDGSIPIVGLPESGQSFRGQWLSVAGEPNVLDVRVVGASGSITRTIAVRYYIEPYRFPIFNYGVATKGALRFPQNPTLTGAVANWEADIYVESPSDLIALQVGGNANFDGDIDIGNPLANVNFKGDVQIGGDSGQTAIDNHVTVGAEPVEFPVPELTQFHQYATGPVLDPNTDFNSSMTLANAVIPAGMNPTFLGNVILQGILLIEQPNVVTFGRNVELQGLIVAEGDAYNPGANAISFQGNFASSGYPSGSQFDAIRQEVGSSILAPGFGVSFTGNFASVNGVMAAGSLYFSANASATVRGTMISYSPDATYVQGNISMNFDRADMVEIPAGFDLLRVLNYSPSSYAVLF
ncbi:MAG: hypothetical protein A2Y76_09960 [Planctomycetes bacterium RBG_13_60_9]|nr:MAG: hypothetical protein A2Y76_09960 [Planctomycetes bacterium RBG_13_60_9]